MLLTLREYNTTDSFLPYHLFCVLHDNIVSDYICARVHLYTTGICADGTIKDMCVCLLLVATCVVCYWLDIVSHALCLCECYVITDTLNLLPTQVNTACAV